MPVAAGPDLAVLEHALAGCYILDRPLGRGGMGAVYLAREIRLDRLVAIKVLPPSRATDEAARTCFLREARTAARLSHPNIVPIHAVDEAGEMVYYTMAYVEGETLGERIRRTGPLSPPDGARLLRDVAWAMAYAHARGVVHRDIKPDNILLEVGTGRALVTDFGIARVETTSDTTGPHEVVGTAEFMSPEQAAGDRIDARSDIYSLGVLGFYTLSGHLPFVAKNAQVILAQHISDPAPPLARVAPWVPKRLARSIDRCLAKNPDARFQRAEDLADEMTQVLQVHGAAPVAVRAFVTESKHLTAAAALYALFLAISLPPLAGGALALSGSVGVKLGAVACGLAALAVPFAVMLRRVRRFLAIGHDREDLVEVLQLELARQQEELAFAYGLKPSRLERILRVVTYLGLVAGAVAAAPYAFGTPAISLPHAPILWAASTAMALFFAVIARLLTEQRTNPYAERRLEFWRGALGSWFFRVAGLGMRRDRAGELQAAASDAEASMHHLSQLPHEPPPYSEVAREAARG